MKSKKARKHSVIGACGIDCGLCPRYYTKGPSRCPGCGSARFFEMGMSCGHLSCCMKQGEEVCALCNEYPCKRFDAPTLLRDSFVTHQTMLPNNEMIKNQSLENFLCIQQKRIEGLEYLLGHVDIGRSKSFYCLCAALLPLEELEGLIDFARGREEELDPKELDKVVRAKANDLAGSLDISLALNTA